MANDGSELRLQAGPASIPRLGFGTWQLRGTAARRMVRHAIEVGYRHIDTAAMYGNEVEVGQGIADSGVAREALFVTTKVWPDRFAFGELQASARESVARLGLGAVDLLLLHWPSPDVPLAETARALDEVVDEGLARHIGVSNFSTELMAEAAARARAPLVANQVEYAPGKDQSRLLEAVDARDMALVAYCPLARGELVNDPVLAAIGRVHGKSAAQVALRWHLQQPRVCPIPRTSNERRAEENFAVFDFELDAGEMASISRLAP